MYAFIRGEDEHFCFKNFSNRKDAGEWLEAEKVLYGICYSFPEYGVVTDKEFGEKFKDDKYRVCFMWKRYGNRLRAILKESGNVK